MKRLLLVAVIGLAGCARQEAPPERLEFTRLVAHWQDYVQPGYLEFIDAIQPEIVQVGFYGADYFSLAHLGDEGKGLTGPLLPTHAGVASGEGELGRLQANAAYFTKLNSELHQRGVKVIGHFSVAKYLLGRPGPDGPEGGFFRFYRDLWDEKELGQKPVDDPTALLQKDASGAPITTPDDDAGPFQVYYGCLANPQWRTVLKAFVQRGVRMGLDGFMINYFYRLSCLCEHCQRGFRAHLRERYSDAELRRRFGIENLDKHQFAEIVSRHDFRATTPLRLEMQRFSDISNKRAFDDIFLEYGRTLKPGLVAAQWLHSSADFAYPPVSSVDERAMLPTEMWGRGEDYLWYSPGQAEPTLQLRYIRGAFQDKSYTVGKYERVRIRSSIAELAANGGAPMGRYADFTDPAAREIFVRYYGFLKRYEEIYRANRPYAEAVLLHPRSLIHAGQFFSAMTAFQEVGRFLLDRHILFDVFPDEVIGAEQLAGYRRVFTISSRGHLALERFDGFSRFEAPAAVRVSASRPAGGGEIDLHFVNYAREAGPEAPRGAAGELPVAVSGVRGELVLPAGARVKTVEAISPEAPEAAVVDFEAAGDRVRFTAPQFLVYSVIRVHLEE
jgi:hypothetical protein